VRKPILVPATTAATAAAYAPTLTGRAVSFTLSGFEPDFDPLYRVIISAMLHDTRRGSAAVPDAMLVLSAYLEVFQPETTPILPDLLHPDQVAASLAGFLQGKAALVNAGGQEVGRGSLLAEIFANSTVHIVLHLSPIGAPGTTPALQLQGIFTLYKNKTQRGWLRATAPSPLIAALSRPRGHLPSWQAVIGDLAVRPPRMMGTGTTPTHPPARAAAAPPARVPGTTLGAMAALGAAGALALGLAVAWWRVRRRRRVAEAPRPMAPRPRS
jgi:hypothetical protein